MAVKAYAMIQGFEPQSNGELKFSLIVSTANGSNIALATTDAVNPELSGALINGAIKAYVQNYAENEWDVEFTPIVDSVLLVNGVNVV